MVNPISAIADFFSGAATRVFEAVEKFLLQVSTFGLNIVEIMLFLVFIALMIGVLVAPARIYSYFAEFKGFWSRIINWIKN